MFYNLVTRDAADRLQVKAARMTPLASRYTLHNDVLMTYKDSLRSTSLWLSLSKVPYFAELTLPIVFQHKYISNERRKSSSVTFLLALLFRKWVHKHAFLEINPFVMSKRGWVISQVSQHGVYLFGPLRLPCGRPCFFPFGNIWNVQQSINFSWKLKSNDFWGGAAVNRGIYRVCLDS